MQLNGKTALVTGAGRGIGKAIATGFARDGADIVAVSRTLGEIEETAREANAAGRRALAIQADVSQLNDIRRVADEVANRFGRLDILVNNAALRMNQLGQKNSYTIPFTELTVEDWDSAINVNLRGPSCVLKSFCRSFAKAVEEASSTSLPEVAKEGWPEESLIAPRNSAWRD